jgi:hypothetical protein
LRKFTRKLVVTAVATLMLVSAGIAFAAWLVSGTGSARASAATIDSLGVTVLSDLSGLYPGAKKDLVLKIDNSNDFPVTVTAVSALVTGGTPFCAPDNVTVTAALPATPIVLSPNSTGTEVSFDDAVVMNPDPPLACSGASFDVAVSVQGTSPPTSSPS